MPEYPLGHGGDGACAWFRRYAPRPDAAARIVCFGPAGGAPAFFRDWARAVPEDVEVLSVVLPGRERRTAEPALTRMADLAASLARAVTGCLDRPTVFFGHSMGASVAFEVTRRLELRPGPRPVGLVVSGRPSPRRLLEAPSPVADYDDAQIVAYLRSLGGTPDELLDDPAIHGLILPPCRADFEVIGRYAPDLRRARLSTPVRVLRGASDLATPGWDAPRWGEVASRVTVAEALAGGHFYLLDQLPTVVDHVLRTLRGEADPSPSGASAARSSTDPRGTARPTGPTHSGKERDVVTLAPAYHERRIPLSGDVLSTAAALSETSADAYVLYENRGVVGWAEGEHGTITVHPDRTILTVKSSGAATTTALFTAEGGLLKALDQALAAVPVRGWRAYGWAAFELSHPLHGLPATPGDAPLAVLAVPAREVRLEEGGALLRTLDVSELDVLEQRVRSAAALGGAVGSPRRVAADIDHHDAESYKAAVAGAVEEIRAGRLTKVILSRAVPVHAPVDLPATFVEGRRGNDPARSFLLRLGGWEAAGFSPEIVAAITEDGHVVAQPLAGTRALEGDPEGDAGRRAELYRDEKEVFEHAASVRLVVEELQQVCIRETVTVDDFMSIKERGSVQHLASRLSGTLAAGRTAWDAVGALFPAVTASGIPKAEGCDLIRRAEGGTRGLYSGTVLTVDADGTVDAALVLRSVYRHEGRTWLRAGAGIVAHSTPERELEETREKLRSVSRFLVPAAQAPVPRRPEVCAPDEESAALAR
ncbi:salicylate synthase [Streptomyces sp. NRRL F-2664]|uniref:salicylate synthase n=1 Tax=Streptomyces sp. NRRL F-2664 TaxID=1463842 RepID=UPI0009982F0F|nr:salicylate synthase [Streptomyces sp. NRRL F-2664]